MNQSRLKTYLSLTFLSSALFALGCDQDDPDKPTVENVAGADAQGGEGGAGGSTDTDSAGTSSTGGSTDGENGGSGTTNEAGAGGEGAGGEGDELVCDLGTYNRVVTDGERTIADFVRKQGDLSKEWECGLSAELADGVGDAGTPVAADAGDAGAAEADGSGVVDSDALPDFLTQLGCEADFELLAAHTAAGVSVKVLVDRGRSEDEWVDGDYPIHFINSNRFGIHWDFASANLTGGPDGTWPPVGSLADFNGTEYTTPDRRFLLGALTYYPGTDSWVYELAQNDTSDAEMITSAFDLVAKNSWIGPKLILHTTSEQTAKTALSLPEDIIAMPTSEVIGNSEYQALNVAVSFGKLRFITADELENKEKYLDFRDIAVLDRVPNDISVTVGIITGEFQTPLAHINVLSQNRGTPNMAFAGAYDEGSTFRALEDEWVRLEVRQDGYELDIATQEEADAWWEENLPSAVQVPTVDKETDELRDIKLLVDIDAINDGSKTIYESVKEATITYGGKAAHFATLAHIEGLPVPKAFAIPVRYYFEFMEMHGFNEKLQALLDREDFQNEPDVRDAELNSFRDEIRAADMAPAFMEKLRAKLKAEYTDIRMRFRSSTNAEDLDGFTGAGLYTSKSGDESENRSEDDAERTFDMAIKKVWASVWFFRAFEERRYRSIEHKDVGMAILVHRSFPTEDANGVALTDNPIDQSGAYPAFYVNVQKGEASIVLPPPGQTADAYLHHWATEGKRVQFFSYSSLVPADETVLTTRQMNEVGEALAKIKKFFAPAYSKGTEWWAMDVEFKFDAPAGECSQLFVKQARPFGN